jgi:uncharacterized protein YndB with AHSA1/START domain
MTDYDLTITRIFNAPREQVWKAWTDPELMQCWWGPLYFSAPVIKMDFRIGGKYLFGMRSPEGEDTWSTGIFREIVPMEKIVYTDSFSDEKGNHIPASNYGLEGEWPDELLAIITFEDYGKNKTKFTLLHEGMPSDKMRDMTGEGWNGSFDKLEECLKRQNERSCLTKLEFIAEPGEQIVLTSAEFESPRKKVFTTFIDPMLVPHWWGPKSLTTTVEKMDVVPGGEWRIIQRDSDGNEFAFHGVYHEVTAPKKITYTFEYEGMPGHVVLETVCFEDKNGKTRLTETAVFETVQDREEMLKAGMESGAIESMERFALLLLRK